MKRNKVLEYILEKKYYFSLLGCLIVTIVAVSIIYVKTQENEEIANLNEVIPPVEVGDIAANNPDVKVDVNEVGDILLGESNITIHNDEIIGDTTHPETTIPVDVSEGDLEDDSIEAFAQAELATEPTLKDIEVSQVTTNASVEVKKVEFSFDPTSKLLIPINGEILMNYNLETPIYFETLDQYRINTTLRIKADVGTEIMAAADGLVEEIKNDFAKGYTVTIDHGNGYKTVYSQLQEKMNIKKGDTVTKGNIIGYVAEPTSYFILEGSHLCFEVYLNDESINPEELL